MTRKNIIARMVSSNNKIVSSRFFEQSQFEQFTMSQKNKLSFAKESNFFKQFKFVLFLISFSIFWLNLDFFLNEIIMILVSGCLLLAWTTSIGKTLTFDSKRSSGTRETPWTNPSETLSFITNIFCRFSQQIQSKIFFLVDKFTFNSHEQPADDNMFIGLNAMILFEQTKS